VSDPRRVVGRAGEDAVAIWYAAAGFVVLDRNWRVREGELDLIVAGPAVVVFCEVKSRSGDTFGQPFEAVTAAKQARLRRLAMLWLQSAGRSWPAVRFDVASVVRGQVQSVIEAAF
jgi:putative endonuclease